MCVFLCVCVCVCPGLSILQTDREVETTEMGMSAQDQQPCWWTPVGGPSPPGRHCI